MLCKDEQFCLLREDGQADIHILRPEERLSSENYNLNELYGFCVQKKSLERGYKCPHVFAVPRYVLIASLSPKLSVLVEFSSFSPSDNIKERATVKLLSRRVVSSTLTLVYKELK